jgi:signal transduction histidine kinase
VSTTPRGGSIAIALQRVVVGYRIVAVLWLWLLAVVVLVGEPRANAGLVVVTGAAAALATVATVGLAARAPVVLRTAAFIVLDIAISAIVVALTQRTGAERSFFGGYPFSTVLLAALSGGYPAAFGAAVALSVVSGIFLGLSDAVSSSLVYLAGAGVSVWGFGVMRRNETQRRELEQRLAAEEAERVRSQERADTAAALHDSVLQTLALIQRRSTDPAAVSSLARRQERDLRNWLAGRETGPGDTAQATLSAAITTAAAEVERDYPVTIEVVTVGDAALVEGLRAVVAAAREAMVNVAKHAGVATASVFAEAGPAQAVVYVRDRGGGFDIAAVPQDRRGISDSIVARMQRHGGTANITSGQGAGTEVELRIALGGEQG